MQRYNFFFKCVFFASFSDTEPGEDLIEDIRRGGLAGNAADQFGGGAERAARELPGPRLYAFARGIQMDRGLFEQRGMTFGDDGIAGLCGRRQTVPCGFFEAAKKGVEAIARPCGNMLENGSFSGRVLSQRVF